MAKLETGVALECLVSTLGDWEIDEDGIERAQLVPTRGVMRAPIEFRGTAGLTPGRHGHQPKR